MSDKRSLTTIGFDADDTLWSHEAYYQLTEAQFTLLLADFADHSTIANRLLDTERRNLRLYGYGTKGFTLSMIETAIEVIDPVDRGVTVSGQGRNDQ